MNIVLIVMLFILFFLTLQGWRKGILGIVYGLVSWIFIFIFVSVANPYILGYLKTETNIYDKVYEQAEKFVTNKAENLPQDTGLEDWYQSLTDAIPGNALGDVTDSIRQMQTNVEQNPQLQDLLNGLQTQNDLTVAQFGGASNILQLSDGTQTLGQMICGKIADFMMQGIASLYRLCDSTDHCADRGLFCQRCQKGTGARAGQWRSWSGRRGCRRISGRLDHHVCGCLHQYNDTWAGASCRHRSEQIPDLSVRS